MKKKQEGRRSMGRTEHAHVPLRHKVWVSFSIVSMLIVAGVVLFSRIGSQTQSSTSVPKDKPPAEVPEDTSPAFAKNSAGYVGVDACRECHAERVEQFTLTNHFGTCRLPQAEELLEKFSQGETLYRTRNPDCWFEMAAQGDRFVQTAVTRTASGEHRHSEQIGLVYGAGNFDEVFHYWNGNRLYQMPVAYLNPSQEWGNPPGYLDGEVKFTRETGPRCIECHNTYFEHVPGTPNEYNRENLILGVTCERCHGPGRQHVAHHQSHPDDHQARYIVQPSSLSRERQLDLCSQCHSSADKHRNPAFSYRPGEPLEEYYRFAHDVLPEEDHTANQLRYLRESKCFQSDETMTCVDCHNPHEAEGRGNSASAENSCYGCHQPEHCEARPRIPPAVRNLCIDCHMPQRRPMNIWFSSATDDYFPIIQRRDHRIAVHPDATKQVLLEWYRDQDNASDQETADRLTRELVAQRLREANQLKQSHRFLAAIGSYREALRLRPTDAIRQKLADVQQILRKLKDQHDLAMLQIGEQKRSAAVKTLKEMLKLKPNLAMAHGQLGTLLVTGGHFEAGVSHLKLVAKYDPNLPYGVASLGQIYGERGQVEDSARFYQQAVEIDPSNAVIHFHYGLALAKLSRLDQAAIHLRRSLEIDPQQQEVYYKLANLLILQERFQDAVELLERAVRLTSPTSVAVLMTLADTYAKVDRYDNAIATAERALMLASTDDPKTATRIRQRLETYHRRRKNIKLR